MEQITGTVTRANGHGFQLAEREGWLNLSKFANPAPVMPEKGQRVSITIDKAGYVRAVTPMPSEPEPAVDAPAESHANMPSKDIVITRLATLNTATSILSSGSRAVNPDDVLALAQRLEAWATR